MSRVAVVTGAAGGIGGAVAERLTRDGFEVVGADVTGVDQEFRVDLTDSSDVIRFATALVARHTRVDVLVNNAGVWRHAAIADVPYDEARRVLEVNLLGAWAMTQALVPAMPAGAAIVNISSTSVRVSSGSLGLYPSSKGGLEALTRQLAVELGPRGVRVNAVAPGMIRTPATEQHYADGSRDEAIKGLPLGRAGTPADVASAVSFLAGPDAVYVTGHVLTVDGGLTVTSG
jgi:NAD(P)-dependent dehydrogenase (short-subunit alcohol dehydrogenase family)